MCAPPIHDNHIYAYRVDCEARRLVLHTVEFHAKPQRFTDVVFHDVVAHQFEHVLPGNILFDVDEYDVEQFVKENEALFADSWRWGWPALVYKGDLTKLTALLKASSVKAYAISSSFGMSGWVLAGRCERISLPEPCCERMRQNLETTCPEHPDRFDCPDALIHRAESTNTYGLIVHDGGSSFVEIQYCPWCGRQLPRK